MKTSLTKNLVFTIPPRKIVNYMCKEALTNYLFNCLNGKVNKEDLEDLIDVGDMIYEHEVTVLEKEEKINNGVQKSTSYISLLPDSIRNNAKSIDNCLEKITICDPAVGSGAFPVGMMIEIIRARRVLSLFTKKEQSDYNLKRHCIEHSLYGVDIDPGAVEITKLRLWLSLIVDEDDIRSIKPLPNLDYKIAQGNSLLSVERDIFNGKLFSKLESYKIIYFNETYPAKKQEHRRKIENLITKITNGHKEFDFEVYFSEVFRNDGFDVVITNPPYIGEKGHKEIFREIRKHSLLNKFYMGKMDIFYFFFHLTLNIAKEGGTIAFITTNYYPTATGAKKLRQDFKKRAIIKKLVNFNELKIFKSALGQHNMITILQKGHNENAIAQTCITQRKGYATAEVLQYILSWQDKETHYYHVSQKDLYDGDECYIRLEGIGNFLNNPIQRVLYKIKSQGVPLGSICNVNQGIVTGADKVSKRHIEKYGIKANVGDGIFVLSDKEVSNLNLSEKEKEILKPWFKNSDIFRWKVNNLSDKIVLYLNRKRKSVDENIKKHLQTFREILKERREVKNNVIQWWQLQWPRDESIFEGSKIVAPQRSLRNTFGYNEIPWYAMQMFISLQKKINQFL